MERSPALYRYDLPRSPISAVPMALCRTCDSLSLAPWYVPVVVRHTPSSPSHRGVRWYVPLVRPRPQGDVVLEPTGVLD